VNNLNFWQTKCELLEKAILRFEKEGITIAFPQQDVHLYHDPSSPTVPEDDNWPAEERLDNYAENKDATG
jgi:small-conductance mechanosensitive channel